MADFTVDELTQPTGYGVQPNVFEIAERDAKQVQRDKSIEATNGVTQTNTWFKNAGENSVASDFGEWLGEKLYTDFTDDPDYVMDDEVALHAMSESEIPMQYFGEIRKTKSMEELNFRTLTIQRELNFKKQVEDQLTYDGAMSMTGTSVLAGQLLDDVSIGVLSGGLASGVSALAGTTRSVATALMADASLEIGLSVARYNTTEDYGMDDIFTDLTLGLIPSSIVAYRSSGMFRKSRGSASALNNQTQKIADDAVVTPEATPKSKSEVTPDTTAPKPQKQPDPELATVKDMNSPIVRNLVSRLRKAGKNLGVVKSVDELAKTVRNFKNAKTPKQKAKLADEIKALEQSPNVKLVLQASRMVDDSEFMTKMQDDIVDLYSQVDKKTSDAMINAVKKEIGKADFDTLTRILKGEKVTGEAMSKMSKGKLAGVVGAMMVLPAVAEASDDDIKDEIYLGAIALALGAAGVTFIKASGGTKQALTRLKNTWGNKSKEVVYETSPEASRIRQVAVKLSNTMDTELTNTKNLFVSNPEAMDLIDVMVGKGSTIDMNLRQMYEGALGDINRSMRDNFEAWKKINRDGTLDDFNKIASDYVDNIDNIPNPDPIVQKMVNDYHDIMERMYDNAKNSGAKGFEDFVYNRDTMPRLWKTEQMKSLLQGLTKGSDDYNAVVKNLETAFERSVRDYRASKANEGKDAFKDKTDAEVAKSYTEKFVRLWTDKRFSNFSKKGAGQDVNKIKDYLVKNKIVDPDDTDMMDDLIESLVPHSQVSARAKRRVVFNPNHLDDIKINYNGEPLTVGKSTYVERDLMQIADVTSKELSITSAYAEKGFITRSMLDDKITAVSKTDQEFETLMDYKNLLEGMPTLSGSPFVESFIALSRVAVSVVKLPMVGFSTLPEFMNVLGRSGFISGMASLSKAITKRYPPKGEVMQLRDITGLASFNDRLYRKGYIGYDEMNDKLNPQKSLIQFAKTTEDWAYTINRLGWLTDVTQLAGIEANMKALRKFVTTGKGMPISRLDEYGMTQKWMDEFSPDLKTAELDMSGWSTAKKRRFGVVIKSLNQTISPETMLHTKGLWSSTTSFGRLLSPLLNYSATVFNEQGLPLLRHTDRHSLINNLNAIGGAYLGLNLKYAVEGKDVDQGDILTYAITGSPLAGGFGVAKGILNPATLNTTADIYNLVAPETISVK